MKITTIHEKELSVFMASNQTMLLAVTPEWVLHNTAPW
jgi:hypothetical protein